MNSRLIDLAKRLSAVGPNARGRVAKLALRIAWRTVVMGGGSPKTSMPLGPDSAAQTYWTKRRETRQRHDRYLKQY
jgi:hypothetical protein